MISRTDPKITVTLSPAAWVIIQAALEAAVKVPVHDAFRDYDGAISPSKRMSAKNSIKEIEKALKGRK